ncbi:ribosome small subunit-dependent GTPase A [Bacillus sp. ISL-35]|uniref:ribosome small subunit-dependent GTPase A n=1 Tax=Bacillus sp. ISL-35 TaxID=2819122 RepID=UPI001BE946B1|nr:ribosome small subunit-dependent GTPase A [Bacillus sp. ISL-35]MBT2677831.1 ribosome small subunit-dependent GTPase A [Bacillus sp. ISL-35]MBT2705030.1 ribosome small subunit-dependent GTPase A [Chryseobacterium sp. ISL-80]
MNKLESIGMTAEIENFFKEVQFQGYKPGRVALEHKHSYRVWLEDGEYLCTLSGKLTYEANGRDDLPAVGDWVAVKTSPGEVWGTIRGILPRKSKFSRKAAGQVTEEQIVAANIDTVFIVNSLNDDLNLRRIERYLLLAWESGSNPVIILSKADLENELEAKIELVSGVAIGVPVIPVSVLEGTGIEQLKRYLTPGQTVALIGSSGVGKSSLVNYFTGYEKQLVQEIRDSDDKGKHTTTHREMVLLPGGAVLIDTPGMREIQLWTVEEGIGESFADVDQFAEECKFRDCTHGNEPGCAVRSAIDEGRLDENRLASYKKLQKELAYIDRKMDKKAQAEEKRHWKNINKEIRQKTKYK